jgi:PIN domain nuclease of toxin-antitoxin system
LIKVLWDTHVLLWMFSADARMSKVARAAIENETTRNQVSIISLWEISIKLTLGKLDLDGLTVLDLAKRMREEGIELLMVEPSDCLAVQSLPLIHRDPFDCMLAAQAISRQLALVSADAVFDHYGFARIW